MQQEILPKVRSLTGPGAHSGLSVIHLDFEFSNSVFFIYIRIINESMKRILLSFVLILSITASFSQDISGTWGGIISTKQSNLSRNYYFFLEIKQKGRTVWGAYNTSDSNNNKNITCLCSITGSLTKKPAARLDLYKEHIEDFDKATASYLYCNFLNRLSLHYFKENNEEYLAGQWFPESAVSGTFPGGTAGGSFVVKHISNVTERPVDDYFPKLSKMIEKGESDEKGSLIIADDISTATPAEKRMLDAIKSIVIKK